MEHHNQELTDSKGHKPSLSWPGSEDTHQGTAHGPEERGVGYPRKKHRPGRTTQALRFGGFVDNGHIPTCFHHDHLQEFEQRKPKFARLSCVDRASGPYHPIFLIPHVPTCRRSDGQKGLARCCPACERAAYKLLPQISWPWQWNEASI